MSNVITLPDRPQKTAPAEHYEEIAQYGHSGPLTVALARRTDGTPGLMHVVMMGAAIGLEIVATVTDDEKGRAIADFVASAVLRAADLSDTEFAAQPEECR